MEQGQVDGRSAPIPRIDGEADPVLAVRRVDGRVTGISSVHAPEKLTGTERATAVSR
ncbi:hypothetical protein [Streptomyces cinerochromogenes]|uniref:hypothetical protein n=1 Tax=Streptomyces cinerochromogenes TaxID=66422 RepID=UPI0033A66F57